MAYSNIDFSVYKTPSRTIAGMVRIFDKDNNMIMQLAPKETANDPLKSLKIEKTTPEGKLFGYVVIQKLTMELIGKHEFPKDTRCNVFLGAYQATNMVLCSFYVESCDYSIAENKTTIIAYDILNQLKRYVWDDIDFGNSMTMSEIIQAIAQKANYGKAAPNGVRMSYINHLDEYSYQYDEVNLKGNENLLDVMIAACEALGTICYAEMGNRIILKRIDFNATADTITRADYFELAVGIPMVMNKVAHITELGDDLIADSEDEFEEAVFCQTIRENPFFTLKSEVMSSALGYIRDKLGGVAVYPYNLKWRGCPYYYPGDILMVETDPGEYVPIIYGNDTITYTGGMVSEMGWAFGETNEEPPASANTIGDALKETYAKVDKVNNEIILVAGDITQLRLNMDGISAEINGLQSEIDDIVYNSKVGITAQEATMLFEKRLKEGLTTSMGYSFTNDGMKIARSTSDITTQITEDGMKVYIGEDTVLTANNLGVEAKNLEATTYLIIGGKCYFEYQPDIDRMVCFWI